MRRPDLIAFVLLLGLLLFLGFNRHSKDSHKDYHSVLWSDAGGYHFYLPLVFRRAELANMNSEDSLALEQVSGMGVKYRSGALSTKYPLGTALMKAPFYLVGHAFYSDSPLYSAPYQRSSIVSGVVYTWIGLLILFLLLKRFEVNRLHRWIIVLLIAFGTNVFYYTVDSPGFSHCYSFFAFTLLMWSWMNFRDHGRRGALTIVVCTITLVGILRPFNLLWVPFAIIIADSSLGYSTWSTVSRVIKELKFKNVWLVMIPLAFALLQIFAWSTMGGSLVVDSYGQESFANLTSPKILEVLFSTKNGMILYTPMWGVILIALIGTSHKNVSSRWALVLISFVIYAYASWWNWELGCAFGYRGVVELLPIFVVAMAVLIGKSKQSYLTHALVLSFVVLIVWNLKLTYTYDECWLYNTWDYQVFFDTLVFSGTR